MTEPTPHPVYGVRNANTRRHVKRLQGMLARVKRILAEKQQNPRSDRIVLETLRAEISTIGWVLDLLEEPHVRPTKESNHDT